MTSPRWRRLRLPARPLALAALVLLGLSLRAHNLDWPPLWSDEAESAINALTIVAEGVPGDHHLGLPLFENTLVRRSPENAEYEFRDISYSDRGLAVYHGWIPLYAIAAAFRVAGVSPEIARSTTPPGNAGIDELGWWTRVPRWPALAFSAVFILAAFALGRAAGGERVGFALALASATASGLVWYGRQARYYSATLAGNAVCGLLVWNAVRRGRLSDHALAGLGIGVLFHVHALCAVTMAIVYAVALPLARQQERLWLRAILAGAITGVLVLPWAAWSGLLEHASHIPPARHYLDFGLFLASLPTTSPVILGVAFLGTAWLVVATVLGRRLPERLRRPIFDLALPLSFALAWLLLAYVVFVGLVPAASYFVPRLRMTVAVPGLLVIALVLAAAGRAARPSAPLVPSLGIVLVLALAGQLPPRLSGPPDASFAALVARVRSLDLGEGGRVFAEPNSHLVFTYYSGRPIQSVAPVRREWLENRRVPLAVLEYYPYELVSSEQAVQAARRLGVRLTPEEARQRAGDVRWVIRILDLEAEGIAVTAGPRPIDGLDRAIAEVVREATRKRLEREARASPIQRAIRPVDWGEFFRYFFYWFSNPEQRTGAGLNYAACRASGHAEVDPTGVVVIVCGPPGLPGGGARR